MRLLALCLILILSGCLESKDKPAPEPEDKAINVTLYTYDVWDPPAVHAATGDLVRVNAGEHTYDTSLDYSWIAWTGEDRGWRSWNATIFDEDKRSQPLMEFTPTFPGLYKISWCPTDSQYECVLYGELEVSGEVPENDEPTAEFVYSNETDVSWFCSNGCTAMLPLNEEASLIPDITDDDTEHTFSLRGYVRGNSTPIFSEYGLSPNELRFTPEAEGLYRFTISLYDGHNTIDGPQRTEYTWTFNVRDEANGFPRTQIDMQGQVDVSANMEFQFDSDKDEYFPVINYYYEDTISIADCSPDPNCTNERLHFDLFQNLATAGVPTVAVDSAVTFSGANSTDPDNDDLSYIWSGYFLSDVDDTASALPNGEDSETYTFTPDEAGEYFVSLCVQESDVASMYRTRSSGLPYYWLPYPLCAQIQFNAVEK